MAGNEGAARCPSASVLVKCIFIFELLFTVCGTYVLCEVNSAGTTFIRFPLCLVPC